MPIHLHRELEKLNRSALEMSAHVEQNVRDAAAAFLDRDIELAEKVVAADRFIDRMEVDLAENCLKTMALYQPVAKDLRFIFSLAKISGILERIGDLAENLARKGKALARRPAVPTPPDFAAMAEQARLMLRGGIDSLVDADPARAKEIIRSDNLVNAGKRSVRKTAESAIMAAPETCPQWLIIVAASRNVERMADMAANIAAEVVYSVEGRMVRHGFDCEDG